MKLQSKIFFILLFILLTISRVKSQEIQGFASLQEARLEPFKMEVTYNKTSHILFPSPIRYVDLGSESLIANKAGDIANVLRVKSSVRDFEEETNFSVVTEDGRFYSFDVFYSTYPDTLSYDLSKLERTKEQQYNTDVLFEELEGESSSLTELMIKILYEIPKRTIRHIGSKSFGIQFFLKSLYVYEGKFYFIMQIKNKSNLSFHIDFVNFKIADKKNLKRTVVQDKILSPLRTYPILSPVNFQSNGEYLFLLDQFTLLEDQVLEIELMEKDGGRHQKIQIENPDLIHAKIVDDLHLKLK
ncbi:conjugative transposon TraN protein [Chryseobacterium bernardetii]|uniref:Conjugative transposon TraN protein n=1 Tax=Chryseobacterium bernardetii TaxID=1241978 RepID=A0ACC6IXV3_9FLAO|nr:MULTISPECIES: conjugative transposon protein TraN [Chryseobacterium]MDR6372160.1 conjugative transposon TraN protein [Chryseobacterium vietnamense]MDR6442457.1 conjugative transposon TraN protein [Chryseobacterium bernardetii]